jgi:hypothetical protein
MYIEGKPIIIMLGISMEYAWKVVECGMEYDVMGLGGGGWGGRKMTHHLYGLLHDF